MTSHICWLVVLHLPVYSPASNHVESFLRFGPDYEYKYGTVPIRKDKPIYYHLRAYYTSPPIWKPKNTGKPKFEFLDYYNYLPSGRIPMSIYAREQRAKENKAIDVIKKREKEIKAKETRFKEKEKAEAKKPPQKQKKKNKAAKKERLKKKEKAAEKKTFMAEKEIAAEKKRTNDQENIN